MKTILPFLRLIRWPNLIVIFLTQLLFEYGVTGPVLLAGGGTPRMQGSDFALVTLAFVCIAAAGYIINDYYDLAIDEINKPGRVFIRKIGKRAALAWYVLLNTAALGAMLLVSIRMPGRGAFLIVVIDIAALFFYSASLKKKFLVGNLLVAAVTASAIPALTLAEGGPPPGASLAAWQSLAWLTALYTGFAFLLSLIREAVKDLEDMEGDRQFGCRTMPIVWGPGRTRRLIAAWLGLLSAVLIYVTVLLLRQRLWLISAYAVLLVIIPLILILRKLFAAKTPAAYHKLSSGIKIVMLTGILSMLLLSQYL